MFAADVMTQPALAIDPQAPLAQAIRLMTEHKVSGLPVVEKSGAIVGIVTEGDLMRRVETQTTGDKSGWLASFFLPGRDAEKFMRSHGRRVEEVMATDVVTVTEDTPLDDVVRLMERHRIKRVPVVRERRLVGVVSRADLMRRVGEALSAPAPGSDDATIERAIRAAMKRETWAIGSQISIGVHDGVVDLDGCLFDLRERDALGVLAENVPGVKRVDNRIVCIEPVSGFVTFDPAAAGTAA